MTVATTPPRVDYIENGVTLTHAVPFQFFDETELVVTRIEAADVSDSGETVLTLNVDYTVDGGGGDVGSITKTAGGVDGATLRIDRNTKRSQELDYRANDDFPAEAHEEGLDRLEMQIQEIRRDQLDAEAVRDILAATLRDGFGIRLDVDDVANTITIVNTAAEDIRDILDNMPDCVKLSGDAQTNDGAGGVVGTDRLNAENVRDIIGAALTAGDNVEIAVDDAADTITVSSTAGASAIGGVVAGTNITVADNGDGTITIACTALDAAFQGIPVVAKNAAFTFADDQCGKAILYTGSAAAATIDLDAGTPLRNGWTVTIRNKGTGALTVTRAAGVALFVNGGSVSKNAVIAQGGWATLQRWAADDLTIAGPNCS